MGPHYPHSKTLRHSKWRLMEDEFPPSILPPYESGSAYIMTSYLIADIYETARYIKPIFIDDVYITGIVARLVGDVHHEWKDGFAYNTDGAPHVCFIVTNLKFAMTRCNPQILNDLWRKLGLKRNLNCGI